MSASESLDPYQFLQIVLNPDGTLTRLIDVPRTSPTPDLKLPVSVLTEDLTINQSHATWVRLFLPCKALNHHPSNKLPLIVFFHGSGFVILSAASTIFHYFCSTMANDIEAVVASVEYRLAPEHRLPAAYDDAVEALHWIKISPDDWLRDFVDYSNCYVMGNSAGGAIAYSGGLRITNEAKDLEPMKIKGMMLRQPFFGGIQRTESEVRRRILFFLVCVSDLMWDLALPVDVNRDHECCNPTVGNWLEKMGKIREVGWKVMVSVNGGEPLVDRERELARLMEEKGVKVVIDFEDGVHGVELIDAAEGSRLVGAFKQFISSSSSVA
ncbi:carboxylesterase 1-like [Prosopis cineraria]|uniref:carboxylesterase 1-like n=1 Tax=Prosopis cineraria TaxID=364024 RepID=UPI00240ECB64|nr:carboxylesterase 1-like [Prosopis cineraria]